MKTSVIARMIKSPMKTITKNNSKSVSLVIMRAIRVHMAMIRAIFSDVIIYKSPIFRSKMVFGPFFVSLIISIFCFAACVIAVKTALQAEHGYWLHVACSWLHGS